MELKRKAGAEEEEKEIQRPLHNRQSLTEERGGFNCSAIVILADGSYCFEDQATFRDNRQIFVRRKICQDTGHMATVSVIIPTYTRWPMVGEAIDSVLAQGCKDIEIVVVDDGSEDDTAKQLSRYGTTMRLFSQPRRGVASARNLGARQSTAKYLSFLDSDDLWKSKKLEVQLHFMESHPEVEICQTEEIWIRNGMRVNPKKKHRKPSGDIFRASLDLCLISPSAVMMTRKLFERKGRFDESFPVCEDYDLWLRVAADTRVPLIPEALVIKRGGHQDQLSHSMWGLDRFRIRALSKVLKSGISDEKRAWALAALKRKVAVLSQGARKRGREREALNYEAICVEFMEN